MTTTIGTIELLAKIDTSQYKKGEKEIEQSNDNIEKSVDNTSKNSNNALNSIAKVGMAGIIAASVAVGIAITKNIGNAIDRIDTLVAFPRLLQSLGASSEEAQSSTNRLKDALQGLPTSLDAGARGVQRLVVAGVDVNRATEAFLGLNNAILAGGGDVAQAESLFLQLGQAISRGSIEGQEWNTIAANLPTVLQALQNETGKTKNELEQMFKQDPQALLDNIIRLNKEGGGNIASLETQARQATGGIGTAFDNLDNAITRGIEGIVRALGNGDLEKGQLVISQGITNIGNSFGTALTKVGNFFAFIIRNKDVFVPIMIAISTITGLLFTWAIAVKTVAIAQGILNSVLALNPIGLVIIAIAGLVAAFVWLWNNVEGFKNFFVSVWDIMKNAVASAWQFIVDVFSGIGQWFSDRFMAVRDGIVNAFNSIKRAVGNVWEWIRGVFGTIGEVAATIIKAPVNAIIGFAQNTINGFIRAINGAVDAINKIPGVDIGKLGEINIPKLANGGIVTSPTLALIGEGRESEAVIPLSKLDKMIEGGGSSNNSKIVINMDGIMARSRSDLRAVAKDLIRAIDEEREAKGLSPINGAIS